MSDNVTEFDFSKSNKGLVRRVISISLVTLLVLAVLAMILFPGELNLDAVRRWIRYLNVSDDGTYGEFAYDAHNSNRYGALGDGLALASVAGLNGYSAEGVELVSAQSQFSLPVLQTAGELGLAYDAGGNVLLLIHGQDGELLRIDEPGSIYDAYLASDGSFSYITSNSGHKSVLCVYDSDQQMRYRWLSATTYMPVCAVAPGAGQLAAIGLGQTDGEFESSLYFFDTTQDAPAATVGLGNELIYDLAFLNGQTVAAVGETSAAFVSAQSQNIDMYSYEGQFLKDYDFGGNGFLTLLLNMYKAGNRCTLVTVDKNGKQVGSLYLGQEVLDLSAAGRYVAVLSGDKLTVYNDKLQVYAETYDTGTASSVVMRADGTVLLLGSSVGKLFIP